MSQSYPATKCCITRGIVERCYPYIDKIHQQYSPHHVVMRSQMFDETIRSFGKQLSLRGGNYSYWYWCKVHCCTLAFLRSHCSWLWCVGQQWRSIPIQHLYGNMSERLTQIKMPLLVLWKQINMLFFSKWLALSVYMHHSWFLLLDDSSFHLLSDCYQVYGRQWHRVILLFLSPFKIRHKSSLGKILLKILLDLSFCVKYITMISPGSGN